MSYNANFDTENVHSVELNLLDSQVDLILRSLELYGYNLEFMLNTDEKSEEAKQEKLAKLKYTYEQILSCLAEQVNGKAEEYDKRQTIGKNMMGDNIINIIQPNKEINVG